MFWSLWTFVKEARKEEIDTLLGQTYRGYWSTPIKAMVQFQDKSLGVPGRHHPHRKTHTTFDLSFPNRNCSLDNRPVLSCVHQRVHPRTLLPCLVHTESPVELDYGQVAFALSVWGIGLRVSVPSESRSHTLLWLSFILSFWPPCSQNIHLAHISSLKGNLGDTLREDDQGPSQPWRGEDSPLPTPPYSTVATYPFCCGWHLSHPCNSLTHSCSHTHLCPRFLSLSRCLKRKIILERNSTYFLCSICILT